MSGRGKPISQLNSLVGFAVLALLFRESSGPTPRREDENGWEYIDLFRIWFFGMTAKSRFRNHPAATASYRSNPVL
jgi:hypothetical protein